MSFFRPDRASHPRHQSGSVLVTVGVGLSAMVILLASLDLGFLYFYKREYQKAADIAAMAGAASLIVANGSRDCVGGATPAAQASALGNLGTRPHLAAVDCGRWVRAAATPEGRFDVSAGAEEIDAVRVLISGTPPRFLLGAGDGPIGASAIAVASQPVAQLRIRSTVADVDTERSALLNGVVGGLLGGSINLSAVAWQGLLDANINLLNFLDALALDMGVAAGGYDQVLGTDVTLGELLDVAADVLENGGGSSTGDLDAAIGGLELLAGAGLPGLSPLLQLGDLLNVQTGTPASGLDTTLNLLDLVQGSVQLANLECGVLCATVPISLPGGGGVTISARAIEPPQLSAIGNPELAAADPLGPDRIFVRTAQVRTLVSLDLPIAGATKTAIEALLNNTLVTNLTTAVNDVLTLNLVGLVNTLSCLIACDIQRDVTDILVLASPRLDINIDAGSGQSYVDESECTAGKSLGAPTQTAAADVRIGQMGSSAANAAANVFASSSPPTVSPVPLLDIGSRRVRYQCTLLLICSTTWQTAAGTWTSDKAASQRIAFAGGGIGLRADVAVAGTNSDQVFSDPPVDGLPDLGQDPAWNTVDSTGIVEALGDALTALELEFYQPSNPGIGLGNVLSLVGTTANTLVSTITDLVEGVVGPLLDPIVDFLVDSLGVNLAEVDIGANMSCAGGGATLVD